MPHKNSPLVCFVMGATCAGKTTFLNYASAATGRVLPVSLVQVGKMFREKYPPSHFEGQAAPEHTAGEAWEWCAAGIDAAAKKGSRLILVDGQPRSVRQVQQVHAEIVPIFRTMFVLLHADLSVRMTRASRDESDPAKKDLTTRRLTNDLQSGYEVLTTLLEYGHRVQVSRTDTLRDAHDFAPLLSRLVSRAMNTNANI